MADTGEQVFYAINRQDPHEVWKVVVDSRGKSVERVGRFESMETAASFIRAWNGEENPR